jgi:propionyl-CoA carboxylase alpha chain
MIKASAGGGGKGMRIAHSAADVAEGFARARSEALSSFGDDRMFIEKFIVNPRHIEIQVLGDKHGNIIHLGERECSIQRRNQKVIEEAPSPLLDAETRRAMGAQAVALAKAVNYDSAGTIEFVAAQDKSFFFLEMNTRLQVEHPVTELVTGIDLVEEMIRIAAGEKLRLRQEDVTWNGWAVESRIYAEDPTRDFLPSVGRLTTYRPPAEGTVNGITVRNDTGVREGQDISIHYDPMIAKLVTHAPTRLAAIEAQSQALDGFAIEGIRNNIPFLSCLTVHPRWREGRLSTGFIAEEFPEGFASEAPTGETELRMMAMAAHIDHVLRARKRTISGQLKPTPNVIVEEDRVGAIGKKQAAFKIRAENGNGITFQNGDRLLVVESGWRPGDIVWTGTVDAESLVAQVRPVLNGVHLSHAGASADFRVFSKLEAELVKLMPERPVAESSRQLLCPMPGMVQKVFVVPGQKVRASEALLVVEAMKMENVLRAERDGTVSSLFVKAGDSLAVDAVILEIT